VTVIDPVADPEKALLLDYLRGQRRHVLGIIDGLSEADLRRPVLPSGWSCLDMVRHLTVDEEQFWFGAVVAGDAEVIAGLDGGDDSWTVPPEVPVTEVLDRYRDACARSDEIVAATPLGAPPAWWPGDLFGDWRIDDLREVMLHLIAEIACHAGHLDAARELIDGRQWMVLTE